MADREKIQEDPETCDHPVDQQTAVNKFLVGKINDMLICCSNKTAGCDWVGKVGSVENHELNCPFRCSAKSDRSEEGRAPSAFQSMMQEVDFRFIICQKGCGLKIRSD